MDGPPTVRTAPDQNGRAGLLVDPDLRIRILAYWLGLPSVPIEHLDDEPTPRLRQLSRDRARSLHERLPT